MLKRKINQPPIFRITKPQPVVLVTVQAYFNFLFIIYTAFNRMLFNMAQTLAGIGF